MIARVVEVLPGAVGKLACVGLSLLFVGGCTVVMIKHEPLYGILLGVVVLIGILPGTLRWIADTVERRAAARPDEPSAAATREPTLDRGAPEETDPRDLR